MRPSSYINKYIIAIKIKNIYWPKQTCSTIKNSTTKLSSHLFIQYEIFQFIILKMHSFMNYKNIKTKNYINQMNHNELNKNIK